MKNKYLTKCLCVTMAAALSLQVRLVSCSRRDILVSNRSSDTIR